MGGYTLALGGLLGSFRDGLFPVILGVDGELIFGVVTHTVQLENIILPGCGSVWLQQGVHHPERSFS